MSEDETGEESAPPAVSQRVGEDGTIYVKIGDEEEYPIPLGPALDPDEEGIDEEEREHRIQVREEALRKQQEQIAELLARHGVNADPVEDEMARAAREEAERIAALNKEMFEYLKERTGTSRSS